MELMVGFVWASVGLENQYCQQYDEESQISNFCKLFIPSLIYDTWDLWNKDFIVGIKWFFFFIKVYQWTKEGLAFLFVFLHPEQLFGLAELNYV